MRSPAKLSVCRCARPPHRGAHLQEFLTGPACETNEQRGVLMRSRCRVRSGGLRAGFPVDPSCPFLCSHSLGHISPIFPPFFPRFLRVFTVSTRRFQRAASQNSGPRDSGKGVRTPFRRSGWALTRVEGLERADM